jgi:hypothetical protein
VSFFCPGTLINSIMTTTNIQTRQPSKMDYASPIQFRFKIAKLPLVEFFVQSVNLPGISIGDATVPTSLYNYPVPGDEISYQSLDISFLVDENLNNYKELHDWISGLGFGKTHQQFADMRATGTDRFPGTVASTAASGTATPGPIPEGSIYSDATLTILNSKNIAKTEVRFQNVFPTSIGSLSYNVQASDIDYLKAQASFTYLNYDIVQLSTT